MLIDAWLHACSRIEDAARAQSLHVLFVHLSRPSGMERYMPTDGGGRSAVSVRLTTYGGGRSAVSVRLPTDGGGRSAVSVRFAVVSGSPSPGRESGPRRAASRGA